jgi:CheY-like chemotaxis protein
MNGPILIVEDIPHILELLEVTLKFKGYDVMTARNGDEALELIGTDPPVLILTDILMPRLDGYALAQAVRSNPETRHIPIIFISATFITPEDKEFALSLGAVRFLEKPIEASELLLTVAEVMTGEFEGSTSPMPERAFQQAAGEAAPQGKPDPPGTAAGGNRPARTAPGVRSTSRPN